MRRADREITDRAEILRVMTECDCCRVGFAAEDGVYIVPMNFGFADEGELGALYFHGAKAGRKADLIARMPTVGFEMDCRHSLRSGETACKYSFCYASVIGVGTIAPVMDMAEKKRALGVIMAHCAPGQDWQFTDAQAAAVAVFRLEITSVHAKANPERS